ncbi:MAG: stage II sporulation protein M [Chthonomonadales bacterium]
MDERSFVENRSEAWDQLAELVRKASRAGGLRTLTRDELRQLGPLYRRIASDLAYARIQGFSPEIAEHLNNLAGRAHAVLYHTDTRTWPGIKNFLICEFPATFRRRIAFFLASAACLAIGGLLGYGLVRVQRTNIDVFVPRQSPFRHSLEVWESGDTSNRIPDAEAAAMASFLMQNNIRVTVLAFAAGILGGVLTALLIFYNGAMLGAFAGDMVWVHQQANFWAGILPHGIVELSATCLAGAAGLSLGWAFLVPGPLTRRDALVLAARDAAKLVVGCVFLLVFAGVVEAYLSHSLLPRAVKIVFGIASGGALYAYLFLAGQPTRRQGAVSPSTS